MLTVVEEVRTCPKCEIAKPFDVEHFDLNRFKGRRHPACRLCILSQNREYYIASAARKKSAVRPLTKICAVCDTEKAAGDFKVAWGNSDGLDVACKPCRRLLRAASDDRAFANNRVDFALRAMRNSAKHRAKKLNLPFDLSIPYLRTIAVPNCPALGVTLIYRGDRILPNSASIDRFYPEHGYVTGNVFIISHLANAIKNRGTSKDVLAVGKWMAEIEAMKEEKSVG